MKKYTNHNDLELLSETALESSLAGFWDWDILTNEEYLSPRFKEMFGYEDHEMENSPEAWQKIAFPEDLPIMFGAFQKHVESKGKVPFRSVVRYNHKNGKTIWVRCNGKVVEWTDSGAPKRAIGCHIDITEEKELEFELKKAISERDVLLREVHHRVKNNLQLILSLARMKQKEKKVDLCQIESSISSIATAYEAIYKTDRFDKLNVLDYLNKITFPIVKGQNVTLNLEAETINKTIDFLIPIGLIVSECVSNTIKHSSIGKVHNRTIDLFAEQDDSSFRIIYKDDGPGFDDEVLNSLDKMESFGISIIVSLVEQLDGEIHFSNENGAKILIVLPSQNLDRQ